MREEAETGNVGRNRFNVAAGQVWIDNDDRQLPVGSPLRSFVVLAVEEDYYPGGRARCELQGGLKKGQRREFYVRLDRFNGNKRGYTIHEGGAVPKKARKAEKNKRTKGSGGRS